MAVFILSEIKEPDEALTGNEKISNVNKNKNEKSKPITEDNEKRCLSEFRWPEGGFYLNLVANIRL